MSSAPETIRVAVCGGGLGGLVFALAVAKYSHITVDIYEGASSFSSFGAGIGIWPRTWDVLGRIGVTETLSSQDSRPVNSTDDNDTRTDKDAPQDSICLRKSDQPHGYEFLRLHRSGHIQTIHRGILQAALVDHLSRATSSTTHFSKRLKSYTRGPAGNLHLSFLDGSHATCDILVGADGINSAVRDTLMQDEARSALEKGDAKAAEEILTTRSPSWTGSVAYRQLVPLTRLWNDEETRALTVPQCPTQFVGKNVNMIVYPISQEEDGGMINMVVFHTQPELEGSVYHGPWSTQGGYGLAADIVPRLEEWEADAKAWFKCVDSPSKWAIHVVRPLHTFVNDRVALIGDAAHAMDPHQGAGAGQAIEDAYTLAELLGAIPTLDAAPRALSLYDSICRPFAQQVARSSRDNAHYLSLCWDGFNVNDTPAEVERKLHELGQIIRDRWDWAWRTDVADTVEKGKLQLAGRCRM